MTEFTISTLRSIYVSNDYYNYPVPTYSNDGHIRTAQDCSDTGWQIIPNILWEHFCSPKDFYEMVIKYEAIHVKGVSCKLFNMIPLQTQLAIQGTTTFTTFNNTIYMMGYRDSIYETPIFDWNSTRLKGARNLQGLYWNPVFKEGVTFNRAMNVPVVSTGTNWWTYPIPCVPPTPTAADIKRQYLPMYIWNMPYGLGQAGLATEPRAGGMTGAFWDPLNRPQDLQELRPGKNAISFNWSAEECDSNIWFNLDSVALLWPYNRDYPWDHDNPQFNTNAKNAETDFFPPGFTDPRNQGDYITKQSYPQVKMREKIPNWRKWPVVPTRWWMKELQATQLLHDARWQLLYYSGTAPQQAAKYIQPIFDMHVAGTEYEMYKYPPTQWFVKMIPLFDDDNKLIRLEAQMWMQLSLHIVGKPRRSALYAPSWGPMPADLYETDDNVEYYLSDVRGRSGGARRTWLGFDAPAFLAKVPAVTDPARITSGTVWSTPSSVVAQPAMFPTLQATTTTVTRRPIMSTGFKDVISKMTGGTKTSYTRLTESDEGEWSDAGEDSSGTAT
ncbi:VP1 [Tilapia parvovirus]|nr:VP1 [Tilapia parvovirus]